MIYGAFVQSRVKGGKSGENETRDTREISRFIKLCVDGRRRRIAVFGKWK